MRVQNDNSLLSSFTDSEDLHESITSNLLHSVAMFRRSFGIKKCLFFSHQSRTLYSYLDVALLSFCGHRQGNGRWVWGSKRSVLWISTLWNVTQIFEIRRSGLRRESEIVWNRRMRHRSESSWKRVRKAGNYALSVKAFRLSQIKSAREVQDRRPVCDSMIHVSSHLHQNQASSRHFFRSSPCICSTRALGAGASDWLWKQGTEEHLGVAPNTREWIEGSGRWTPLTSIATSNKTVQNKHDPTKAGAGAMGHCKLCVLAEPRSWMNACKAARCATVLTVFTCDIFPSAAECLQSAPACRWNLIWAWRSRCIEWTW